MSTIRKRNRLSSPHFYLRDKNAQGPTSIFLVYKFSSKLNNRLKYSIGEFIDPKFWNKDKERARLTAAHPEHNTLNERLDFILVKVAEIRAGNPNCNIATFKLKLDHILGKDSHVSNNAIPSFFDFIDSYINGEKNKTNATSTWAKYLTTFNHIKSYCADHNLDMLDYDDINYDFLSSFVDWSYSPPRNHSQNTVAKSIEVVTTFLKNAHNRTYTDTNGEKHPYHNNKIFFDQDFYVKRIDTSKHPLEFSELLQLYDFDLSQNPRLARVRDLFLVSAFSGLRFSDFSRLESQHIFQEDGQLFIRLFTLKGDRLKKDNEVVIPCIPELQSILNKYNFKVPADISNQKMNLYLKELGKLVGLNRKVLNKSSIAGKVVETEMPIYETITNHTGRYTFITVMINDFNISPDKMVKITGQSLKVLMQYEKGNKLKNAKKVGKSISSQRELKE
jgi:integrase